MVPIHYEGCVASLMSLSASSHLAAQNLPEPNPFKGRITQHHTSTSSRSIKMQKENLYEHKAETVVENEQATVEYVNSY